MIIFGNQKFILSENYFENVTNLESLKISNTNSFTMKPGTFKPLKHLKYLDLTRNNLSQCNGANLGYLSKLSTLNLNNNLLDSTELNKCLIKQTNLRQLYLQNNNIEMIRSETLKNTPNLITLDLKNNPIKRLNMKHCANLANLYLSKSCLNSLKSVKHLPALKHINVEGNQGEIGLLPGMFAHTMIEIIRFKDLQLSKIPKGWLHQCYFLSELKLDNVGLTNIPLDMFADTNNLSKLILSNNNISVLYQTLFSSLNLETIEIAGNRMLNSQVHVGFNSLKFLSIRNTSVHLEYLTKASELLKRVDQIDFSLNNLDGNLNMTGLARDHLKMDFSSNNITRFIFNPDTNFINFAILINKNPLVCDCSTKILLTLLENLSERENSRDVSSRNEASKKYVMKTCGNMSLSCSYPNTINISCPYHCYCNYNSLVKVVTMDCRNKNLSSITIVNNVKIPEETRTVCVYMQGNMITNVTSTDIRRITTLVSPTQVELHLSDNLLTSLELDWLPSNLRLLYLERNNLIYLSRDLIKTLENNKNSLRLRLGKNPYRCDCKMSRFVYAIIDIIEDVDDMICTDENIGDMKVVEYDNRQCYDTLPYYILSIAILSVVFVAALYSCRLYTPVQLTLYISYAPEDKVLAASIQEELVSSFPNISILTWEDAAAGQVILQSVDTKRSIVDQPS